MRKRWRYNPDKPAIFEHDFPNRHEDQIVERNCGSQIRRDKNMPRSSCALQEKKRELYQFAVNKVFPARKFKTISCISAFSAGKPNAQRPPAGRHHRKLREDLLGIRQFACLTRGRPYCQGLQLHHQERAGKRKRPSWQKAYDEFRRWGIL
jgi:hypothetical protein